MHTEVLPGSNLTPHAPTFKFVMSDEEGDREFRFVGGHTVNRDGDRIYAQFEAIVHGAKGPTRYVVKTGDAVRLLSTDPLDYVALVTEMGETRQKRKRKVIVDQWMRVRWFYRTEDIKWLPKGTREERNPIHTFNGKITVYVAQPADVLPQRKDLSKTEFFCRKMFLPDTLKFTPMFPKDAPGLPLLSEFNERKGKTAMASQSKQDSDFHTEESRSQASKESDHRSSTSAAAAARRKPSKEKEKETSTVKKKTAKKKSTPSASQSASATAPAQEQTTTTKARPRSSSPSRSNPPSAPAPARVSPEDASDPVSSTQRSSIPLAQPSSPRSAPSAAAGRTRATQESVAESVAGPALPSSNEADTSLSQQDAEKDADESRRSHEPLRAPPTNRSSSSGRRAKAPTSASTSTSARKGNDADGEQSARTPTGAAAAASVAQSPLLPRRKRRRLSRATGAPPSSSSSSAIPMTLSPPRGAASPPLLVRADAEYPREPLSPLLYPSGRDRPTQSRVGRRYQVEVAPGPQWTPAQASYWCNPRSQPYPVWRPDTHGGDHSESFLRKVHALTRFVFAGMWVGIRGGEDAPVSQSGVVVSVENLPASGTVRIARRGMEPGEFETANVVCAPSLAGHSLRRVWRDSVGRNRDPYRITCTFRGPKLGLRVREVPLPDGAAAAAGSGSIRASMGSLASITQSPSVGQSTRRGTARIIAFDTPDRLPEGVRSNDIMEDFGGFGAPQTLEQLRQWMREVEWPTTVTFVRAPSSVLAATTEPASVSFASDEPHVAVSVMSSSQSLPNSQSPPFLDHETVALPLSALEPSGDSRTVPDDVALAWYYACDRNMDEALRMVARSHIGGLQEKGVRLFPVTGTADDDDEGDMSPTWGPPPDADLLRDATEQALRTLPLGWTAEQDAAFRRGINRFGERFSLVAQFVPGRTAAELVDYFYRWRLRSLRRLSQAEPAFSWSSCASSPPASDVEDDEDENEGHREDTDAEEEEEEVLELGDDSGDEVVVRRAKGQTKRRSRRVSRQPDRLAAQSMSPRCRRRTSVKRRQERSYATTACPQCDKSVSFVLTCSNPSCGTTQCGRCFRAEARRQADGTAGLCPSAETARRNPWWLCLRCCPLQATAAEAAAAARADTHAKIRAMALCQTQADAENAPVEEFFLDDHDHDRRSQAGASRGARVSPGRTIRARQVQMEQARRDAKKSKHAKRKTMATVRRKDDESPSDHSKKAKDKTTRKGKSATDHHRHAGEKERHRVPDKEDRSRSSGGARSSPDARRSGRSTSPVKDPRLVANRSRKRDRPPSAGEDVEERSPNSKRIRASVPPLSSSSQKFNDVGSIKQERPVESAVQPAANRATIVADTAWSERAAEEFTANAGSFLGERGFRKVLEKLGQFQEGQLSRHKFREKILKRFSNAPPSLLEQVDRFLRMAVDAREASQA